MSKRRLLLPGLLLGLGLATAGYIRYQTSSRSLFDTHLPTPRPPIWLRPTRFPCLKSLSSESARRRVVDLHGADWILHSTVEPQCFPEREIVLSVEEGRGVLQHPITERVKFWIVKQGGVIYAKIVESSGSVKLDMDALDLATNHKRGLPNGESRRNQLARVIVYM